MFTNKAFLFFYLLLSLVQAILEICLETTKALIRHCLCTACPRAFCDIGSLNRYFFLAPALLPRQDDTLGQCFITFLALVPFELS